MAGWSESPVNPLWKVGCALARPELDDAKLREPVSVERVLPDDVLDLLPTFARRDDDPAVPRDFPAGDEKVARCVVLLQKRDVRRHVRVDVRQICRIRQLDDEHGPPLTVARQHMMCRYTAVTTPPWLLHRCRHHRTSRGWPRTSATRSVFCAINPGTRC